MALKKDPIPWLSILFCVALILLASSLSSTIPTMDGVACAADDKVAAVCIRNWANAAGNLLTGIVAAGAAFFAFGQWQASRKQASSAILPSLESRIKHVSQVYDLSLNVEEDLRQLKSSIDRLKLYLKNMVTPGAIKDQIKIINDHISKLDGSRTALKDLVSHLHADGDANIVGISILDEAYHASHNEVQVFFLDIKQAESQIVLGKSQALQAVKDLNSKMGIIDKTCDRLQSKVDKITYEMKELQDLVGMAIRRRLIVLDLI